MIKELTNIEQLERTIKELREKNTTRIKEVQKTAREKVSEVKLDMKASQKAKEKAEDMLEDMKVTLSQSLDILKEIDRHVEVKGTCVLLKNGRIVTKVRDYIASTPKHFLRENY